MKIFKTTLVLFGLGLVFNATAQFQKGAVLLEGSAGFSTEFKNKGDSDDSKPPYNFYIGTRAGYFLDGKNEIGVGLGWDKARYNYTSQFSQTSSGVSTSLYWRHYTRLGERLFFSYSVRTSADFDKFTIRDFDTGGKSETKALQLGIGLTPSLVYMVRPKIGLRGSFGDVGFNFRKQKDIDYWESRFSANFTPQSLNFGLFLLINGAQSEN